MNGGISLDYLKCECCGSIKPKTFFEDEEPICKVCLESLIDSAPEINLEADLSFLNIKFEN